MYDDLVKRLRSCTSDTVEDCAGCPYQGGYKGTYCMNGLITEAADAIEELKKVLDAVSDAHNEGYDVGYWAGRRDYETKWIPVTERLPEVNQPVMICAFGKSVGEGVYRGHDSFHHVWKMYASAGTYWDDEVTHYMPLPEPPKEE